MQKSLKQIIPVAKYRNDFLELSAQVLSFPSLTKLIAANS